jgi:deazaflavin-dependent oxidoreductase (nitroreductase family)
MGLAADLSYEIPRANGLQRAVKAFASTRPGAWLFSKLLRHLDNLVQRLSGGRTTMPELLAGLPVLDVTTTGRKSGRQRTSHLISVPIGDSLALLGTNFGQPATPAWALNLEANPRATVRYRDRTAEVMARPATEAEFAQVLASSTPIYPGYRKYQQRIEGRRRLRIFVLEPAGAGA